MSERKEYDHKEVEPRWQNTWKESGAGQVGSDRTKKKSFLLVEFPFPSGEGLHAGHVRSYTAMDVIARKRRRQGENVLYPIGWDAFGLPTENYAIKTGKDPRVATRENTDNFRRQLQLLGISFDWSREVNTTDPKYYKWTQWIFLQLYKKGLAYKATTTINWCPKCKIGLANEEVVAGACERCGTPVEKREKEQWMLAITKYAQRLHDDLDSLDYIPQAKTGQKNWIGPSEGAEIDFPLSGISGQADAKHKVKVFTTRPDTLFGATFLAISPELAKKWIDVGWKASEGVNAFVTDELARRKDDKYAGETEKRGVDSGITAENPATKKQIPVWIVNYVLGDVGTGAIMAVPAHDERDFEFAKKFSLPIVEVVSGGDVTDTAYDGAGPLKNSGAYDGIPNTDAKWKITEAVGGKRTTTFKLRDWVFSRQRYWGEPIPMIFCAKCQWVPVPEKDLPVELPQVERYQPTDNGESPLANIDVWVNVKCPTCGGDARRETDVMPNWAGSSWYYLRYADPLNDTAIASPEALKYFTPVDWYNGGMEHTTLHLLYSRFWHKFLFDIGVVPTSEPYQKRTSHGMILAEGGEKMSKSKGNVVNPDDIVRRYGADTLRVYEMFMGPFDQAIAWSEENIIGPRRFLERVWRLAEKVAPDAKHSDATKRALHETIKKVTTDIEQMGFNTAISQMMILLNALEKEPQVPAETYETLVSLLAPFAPHITEELWTMMGKSGSVHASSWPMYDEKALVETHVTIAVQVGGKVRGTIELPIDATEKDALDMAKNTPVIAKWLGENAPKKVIFVKGKILNLIPDA
jgi:leucyl-tRNA synthetase